MMSFEELKDKCACWLPGLLDYFDAVDLLAIFVLLFTLILVSLGGLSLEEDIVRMIIYASVATMFGTKVLKSRSEQKE